MVSTPDYVPEQGDIVWLDFNPQAGHEQAGRRPAFVLTSAKYNGKVRLGLFCPINTQAKGYPFEVPLPDNLDIRGVILAVQVRSLDWSVRRASFACTAPQEILEQVIEKVSALLTVNPLR
jgi:mRNA interferase MazF